MMPPPSPSETQPTEQNERRDDVLSMVRALHAEGNTEAVEQIVAHMVRETEELKRRLMAKYLRRKTGEGVSSAQLRLFLEQLTSEHEQQLAETNEALRTEADDATAEADKKRRKPKDQKPRGPKTLPPQLRRVDNPIKVADEDRPCPVCGSQRRCIGHDVTHVVDYIPAEVVVRVDRRQKLACDDCEGNLVRAPVGDKLVEGGEFSSAFGAHLLIDKYRDGLPLHRIKQRLLRLGLPVPVSTLADQIQWATDLLRPLWRAATAMVLGSAVMQLDGTGLAVRDPHKNNRKKLGQLWGYIGDEVASYLYTSTGKKTGQRTGELGPEDMLAMRSGYTVADAATLFDKSFLRDDLIECGCSMHARRYFKKALDAGDTRASLVIGAFKKLYLIEQQIKDKPPDDKLAVRKQDSAPIYDKIVNWCTAHQPHEPPTSKTGAAIRYVLNHKAALLRFLDDGRIPMDNGAVERLHIRVALTRKNFLFAGSDAGAERAAVAYTILACCELADVDPAAYLTDVLPRLARGIRLRDAPDLLPLAWKTAHA